MYIVVLVLLLVQLLAKCIKLKKLKKFKNIGIWIVWNVSHQYNKHKIATKKYNKYHSQCNIFIGEKD